MERETQDKPTPENKDSVEVNKIRRLVKKNKAAALGLAVLFVTSTTLAGCTTPSAAKKDPNAILVEKDEDEEDELDDNTYTGGSGIGYYGGGYYFYRGRPEFHGGKAFWSKSSPGISKSGYSGIRGGSASS